jgi:uncharacterized protein YbaP (TraB family)
MRKYLARMLIGLVLLAGPAMAVEEPPGKTDVKPDIVPAHPVIWHVKTPHGSITLFGSLHLLPANMDWLTPEIMRAVRRADAFVFEVPTDSDAQKYLDDLIAQHGSLPAGQSLRAQLSPESQAAFDAAIAAAHLSPALTDREQPWLAALQLNLADTINHNYFPDAGADYVLMSWANAHARNVRYLETVDQQFALLAEDFPMDELESGLRSIQTSRDAVAPLVAAWSAGDVTQLNALMDANFASHPEQKKRLLSDRNRAWAKQIEAMLSQNRDYFITVGAAHLAGPDGVPALLRADGYEVDGP